jgi:hypothetical protein
VIVTKKKKDKEEMILKKKTTPCFWRGDDYVSYGEKLS